ncbi:MAG: DUF433 domain-containing protein [Chloroflexia bacterium]
MYGDRIVVDPETLASKPVINGTRIPVAESRIPLPLASTVVVIFYTLFSSCPIALGIWIAASAFRDGIKPERLLGVAFSLLFVGVNVAALQRVVTLAIGVVKGRIARNQLELEAAILFLGLFFANFALCGLVAGFSGVLPDD